ncbi:hypothetical protein JNB50_14905 [Leifsonia sp. TF02-11]|nr:hypothetical protein [Leifsonia sp. TF02-11]
MADALRLPVRRATVDDAAGVGAAICAAVGAGLHPGWDEAVAAMTRLGEPVSASADPAIHARLRASHRRTREVVRALEEELADTGAPRC